MEDEHGVKLHVQIASGLLAEDLRVLVGRGLVGCVHAIGCVNWCCSAIGGGRVLRNRVFVGAR